MIIIEVWRQFVASVIDFFSCFVVVSPAAAPIMLSALVVLLLVPVAVFPTIAIDATNTVATFCWYP